jgi:hypothetical protein
MKDKALNLVIRYTDGEFHVYDHFVGFERASSTIGESLSNLLIQWLKQLDLDINNIVG